MGSYGETAPWLFARLLFIGLKELANLVLTQDKKF